MTASMKKPSKLCAEKLHHWHNLEQPRSMLQHFIVCLIIKTAYLALLTSAVPEVCNWEYIYAFISQGRGGYWVLTPQIIEENRPKQIKAIKMAIGIKCSVLKIYCFSIRLFFQSNMPQSNS